MLFPFPKIKRCTEGEMKPHKHTQNGAACRAAGSPASCAAVGTANRDLTCSGGKETNGFALGSDNRDLPGDCVGWRGLLLLPEPS